VRCCVDIPKEEWDVSHVWSRGSREEGGEGLCVDRSVVRCAFGGGEETVEDGFQRPLYAGRTALSGFNVVGDRLILYYREGGEGKCV